MIRLSISSVGVTENVLLAAVKAAGVTVIQNAAKEPEIVALCEFLREAGAVIEGIGGSVLIVQGGHELHGIRFKIPADRIVAATYVMGVLGTGGHIFLEDAPISQMESVIRAARQIGAEITVSREGLNVMTEEERNAIPFIRTDIYPGFPTDVQSLLMAVLTTAKGVSVIEERIFENRFRIVPELRRMGAVIELQGDHQVLVAGTDHLTGCRVRASELRGGAALVIAGAMAQGETIIENRHFIERGYEDIARDLRELGVTVFTE